ncbi:MAG TPA: hypothetical protein VGH16_18750 [Candidatus Binatia bacterium]|jgi:tetratricopeptide (TPR) repeat protein
MRAGKTLLLLFVAAILISQESPSSAIGADVAQTKEVEAANASLKRALDLARPNLLEVQQLLYTGKFEDLEKLYDGILLQYQKDADYESPLDKAYGLFRPNNSISPADLDLWVTKTDSYVAYAARGTYRDRQGFAARGDKFINETPESNIKQMIYFHQLAAKDLQTAISKNPRFMPAYSNLIDLAKASRMPFSTHEMAQKAEAIDKRSYYVRYEFMTTLQPRWGGSYELMAAFAQHAIQYLDVNARLWTLQAEVDTDRGNLLFLANNHAAAIQSYTKALQFGDRLSTLNYRALCYEKIGEKDKAVADVKKVLYYEPTNELALRILRRNGGG